MAEILHIEILRKHGQTHTQTDRQTDMGITIPRPPPMGGEVIIILIGLHIMLCMDSEMLIKVYAIRVINIPCV